MLEEPLSPQPEFNRVVSSNCDYCNALMVSGAAFCDQCGYPQTGNAEQKAAFERGIIEEKKKRHDVQVKVKGAQNLLYIIAGLNVLFGLLLGAISESVAIIVESVLIGIVFLVLAVWSAKKPFPAVISAFVLYITIHLLSFFVEPTSLFNGIIVKIIIIVAFVKALSSTWEAQQMNKTIRSNANNRNSSVNG